MRKVVTKVMKFILVSVAILLLAIATDIITKGYNINLLLSRVEEPAIAGYKPNDIIYCNDIMQFVRDNDLPNGDYTLKVAARSSTESYLIEVLNVYSNTTYTANTSLGSTTADARMLIVKYHGDLTINQGVTVTAASRKRGMYLCVLGNLTNNGTITMTARGAIAPGQNVYLWKNSDGTYEYIPAVGGAGGAGRYIGTDGTQRQTGGGGGRICRTYQWWKRRSRCCPELLIQVVQLVEEQQE